MTPKEVFAFLQSRVDDEFDHLNKLNNNPPPTWLRDRLEIFSSRWVRPWLTWHDEFARAKVQVAHGLCRDTGWRMQAVCRLLSELDLTTDELRRLTDRDAIVPYFAVYGPDLSCVPIYLPPGVLVTDAALEGISTHNCYLRCTYHEGLGAYVVPVNAESRSCL